MHTRLLVEKQNPFVEDLKVLIDLTLAFSELDAANKSASCSYVVGYLFDKSSQAHSNLRSTCDSQRYIRWRSQVDAIRGER